LSFNLIFDGVLGENKVNRRGAGEERKRGQGPSERRCDKRLYGGNDRRDVMQRDGRRGYLDAEMCGGAERAVRVGNVPDWMDVNGLNRPAGNDQRDAQ